MTDFYRIPRDIPAAHGVDPLVICRLIDEWEKQDLGLHSFMLVRHGFVVAEGWWAPYNAEYPHMLNSMSKSFTSTAIGFAVQDGLLSVDDLVLSFFPNHVEHPHENMQKMTVRHLLTMSTGHGPTNADFIFNFPDPIRAFLSSEVPNEPGSRFVYNTGATYMLSAIIRQVTGKKLLDYLQEKLLDPLGIHGVHWEECPLGNNLGGVGFNVKTEDLAKLGLLYLNEGRWNGQQLLSADWVHEATKRHINNDAATQTPWLDCAEDEPATVEVTDWNRGYGYQFWRCIPQNVYRGDGAFGQYSIVMPDQDAVLAITAGSSQMREILKPVWDILLPALLQNTLPYDRDAQDILLNRLHTLQIALPQPTASPTVLPSYTYQFPHNTAGVERIAFRFDSDERDTLIFTAGGRDFVLHPGRNTWYEQHFDLPSSESVLSFPFRGIDFYADIASAGAWVDENTYELRTVCTHYAYVRTLRFTFVQDRMTLEYHQNAGMPTEGMLVQAYRI